MPRSAVQFNKDLVEAYELPSTSRGPSATGGQSLGNDSGEMLLRFADGSEHRADLLVGAQIKRSRGREGESEPCSAVTESSLHISGGVFRCCFVLLPPT